MKKICSNCKRLKPKEDFYNRSDKPYLLQSHCKSCIKEKRRQYRLANIEKFKKKDMIYAQNNREKRKMYSKSYNNRNRAKRALMNKERYHSDTLFKIKTNICNRMRGAIKGKYKSANTENLLGCSFKEFREYFESLFTTGMNWEKFMSGEIQIDHIIPCNNFDLSKEEDQRVCFHYKNLQPLFAKDNRKKWYYIKGVCHRKEIHGQQKMG